MLRNLMMIHKGALGDNIYTMPCVQWLQAAYDNLYLSCLPQGKAVFDGTRYISDYVLHTKEVMVLERELRRNWLLQQSERFDFERHINFHGVVPGVYMYRKEHPMYSAPKEEKIDKAKGVNFFDEMSKRADVPEAIGQRPDWNILPREKRWLRRFRRRYNIPSTAKVVAWQLQGSGVAKMYPFFDIAVQRGIMEDPNIYVIALGDMEDKIHWEFKYHHGRFINIGSKLSFRKAVLLTSIVDCLVSPETGIFVGAQAFSDVPKVLLATHTTGEHICCGDETTILRAEVKCGPCYNIDSAESCVDHTGATRCISGIDPTLIRDCIFGKLYGYN